MARITFDIMAKDKNKPKPDRHRPPSRDNYRYVYLPKEVADELEAFGKADDRSLSFMVKTAAKRYLAELRQRKEESGE